MRTSKFQTPTSREHPTTKDQGSSNRVTRFGRLKLGAFLVLGGWCLVLLPAFAQYAINWHTIDGGGGTSTNGSIAISGTIAQPDAGPKMTNGPYALTGGFWAMPTAIQTEGAPTLTIAPATPGNASISWSPPLTNWALQETLSLSASAWTNSPSGSTNPIVIPATLPTKFYRLFKP